MNRTRCILTTNVLFVPSTHSTLDGIYNPSTQVISDVVSPEVAEIFEENSGYHDPFEQILDRKARKVTTLPHEIRGEHFIKPLLHRVSV